MQAARLEEVHELPAGHSLLGAVAPDARRNQIRRFVAAPADSRDEMVHFPTADSPQFAVIHEVDLLAAVGAVPVRPVVDPVDEQRALAPTPHCLFDTAPCAPRHPERD